jgi:hypothetical protein
MWLIVTQCIYFTIGAMLQEGESAQIWLISNDLTIFIVLRSLAGQVWGNGVPLSGTQQERTVCAGRDPPMPALEDERAAVCATTPHAVLSMLIAGRHPAI